jgi:hypothetical protein
MNLRASDLTNLRNACDEKRNADQSLMTTVIAILENMQEQYPNNTIFMNSGSLKRINKCDGINAQDFHNVGFASLLERMSSHNKIKKHIYPRAIGRRNQYFYSLPDVLTKPDNPPTINNNLLWLAIHYISLASNFCDSCAKRHGHASLYITLHQGRSLPTSHFHCSSALACGSAFVRCPAFACGSALACGSAFACNSAFVRCSALACPSAIACPSALACRSALANFHRIYYINKLIIFMYKHSL